MKRTGSDLQNEFNLKAESDVVTLFLRVKVSHICNFIAIGIVKSTRHVCDRPEFKLIVKF